MTAARGGAAAQFILQPGSGRGGDELGKISMPHRYLVRWRDGLLCAEYEVEPLKDGIISYAADAGVIGGDAVPAITAREVEAWLRGRFSKVDVDNSRRPSF